MHSTILLFTLLTFVGIANALPIPIMGSTLSIWLTESGFSKEIIGFYALIGIPFSFKILWTPLIDQLSLPFFGHSPRKGWMFLALAGMTFSLLSLSYIDPSVHAWLLALCLFILSLFSSCLYIVGISYELESLRDEQYGMGSFYVITGYRIGLIMAGAGLLYVSFLINWSFAFICLSFLTGLGAILVLIQPEPFKSHQMILEKRQRFSSYPSIMQGFWQETIAQPCQHFFRRADWMLILLLLFTFKLGDHLAKSMEGPFYLSLGFNKVELATASKLWGMIATLSGAFIAGYFVKGKNPLWALAASGMLHALSLACYYILALTGKSIPLLYFVTALSHLTGGIAITIFIYFLWKICAKQFAAVQYALLWSVFAIKADICAFLGGMLASITSWPTFYLIVLFLGVSTAALSYQLTRHLQKQIA